MLRRLDVPFTRDPTPKKLKSQIVIANCSNSVSGRFVECIEPHINAGAWLVSSDWSLQNIVAPAFPGTIGRKHGRHTGDEVVSVEPGLDSYWEEVQSSMLDPWISERTCLIQRPRSS